MSVTAQEKFWKGSFGDDYTKRCQPDPKQRSSFWDLMLEKTQAKSVLEVGCNRGTNLLSLRSVDPALQLVGVDVNREALKEANAAGVDAREMAGNEVGRLWPARFDLVATCGVLIHVSPEALPDTMASIILASRKWVLAVEYSAVVEDAIEYRGHTERLWKRPFGRLYEAMGLKLHTIGELAAGDGFDDCTFWLLCK